MPRGVPNARTTVLDAPSDYDPVDNLLSDMNMDDEQDQAVTFPIRAYNMKQEMERVLIPDKNPGKSDPELRKRIQFFAGSTQVRTQDEYDALATKSGVVFDNFPKGAPDHECPRCKRPFRNMQAFDAHVLTHME